MSWSRSMHRGRALSCSMKNRLSGSRVSGAVGLVSLSVSTVSGDCFSVFVDLFLHPQTESSKAQRMVRYLVFMYCKCCCLSVDLFVRSCQTLSETKSESLIEVFVAYPFAVRTAFFRVYACRYGIPAYMEVQQCTSHPRTQPQRAYISSAIQVVDEEPPSFGPITCRLNHTDAHLRSTVSCKVSAVETVYGIGQWHAVAPHSVHIQKEHVQGIAKLFQTNPVRSLYKLSVPCSLLSAGNQKTCRHNEKATIQKLHACKGRKKMRINL